MLYAEASWRGITPSTCHRPAGVDRAPSHAGLGGLGLSGTPSCGAGSRRADAEPTRALRFWSAAPPSAPIVPTMCRRRAAPPQLRRSVSTMDAASSPSSPSQHSRTHPHPRGATTHCLVSAAVLPSPLRVTKNSETKRGKIIHGTRAKALL